MPNSSVDMSVTIKGPLFSERIDATVKRAMVEEVLDKVDERVTRVPKSPKRGRANNTVEAHRADQGTDQQLEIDSTLNWPRTVGRSWLQYNTNAIKKLAPNVIRKAGRRIAQELGGN